tara:strand:- start:1931 stop:2344 length:414 start_codon:yes stop_codon:yes gene_type:complete
MAWEKGPTFTLSLVASADYSASTNKYKFVTLSTTTGKVEVIDAVTERPIGVLQNTPATDELAEVCVAGVTKVQADAAFASYYTELGPAADGQADAKVRGTDLDEYIVGVNLETATAAAELMTCMIDCRNAHTAAATS